MMTFEFVITDPAGIHARPAGLLVKEVAKYKSKVSLKKGEKSVDARRLIGVMSLAAKCGDTLTVTVDGPDEAEAVPALQAFMSTTMAH